MSQIVGELVWIEGRNGAGPVAEKWPLSPIDAVKRDKKVLRTYPLNAEQFSMKLAILEQRCPAPAKEGA